MDHVPADLPAAPSAPVAATGEIRYGRYLGSAERVDWSAVPRNRLWRFLHGPHSIACAALIPDRVVRCVAAASPAPWDLVDFDPLAGVNAGNVEEFTAALAGEEAHRAIAEREAATALERLREGRADWLGDAYEMSESDRVELARDLAGALDDMEHALAPGVDGWVDDMLALVKPWGVDLGTIRCPVRVDYGRTDAFVPAANGDWLVAHVPGAIQVITDTGHLGNDELYEDLLRWAVAPPD